MLSSGGGRGTESRFRPSGALSDVRLELMGPTMRRESWMTDVQLTSDRSESRPASGQTQISAKPIPLSERLIVALDVPTHEEAQSIVDELGESVDFYKLGLELFLAGDYMRFATSLIESGKKVFVDLKFFDVPETVRRAVRNLDKMGATFATVHGNDAMLRAACENHLENNTKILAVTVLTSLDRGDLRALGFEVDEEQLVLSRARRALEIGCDGVISSAREARSLRDNLGERFLIVTPGIRPVDNDEIYNDDQKRTATVEEAFRSGADYVVIGRPLLRTHAAGDRRWRAEELQQTIRDVFAG